MKFPPNHSRETASILKGRLSLLESSFASKSHIFCISAFPYDGGSTRTLHESPNMLEHVIVRT